MSKKVQAKDVNIPDDFVAPPTVADKDMVFRDNSTIITGQEACAKIVTFEGKEFYVKENVMEINLGREKI